MDDDDRKIGMLIAAFHDQRQQLQATLDALGQTGAQLQREVRGAAKGAEAALAELKLPIHQAGEVLIDLQRLSLWRADWQHAIVAVVAMVIALLAVWWYVPPLSEITARRAERDRGIHPARCEDHAVSLRAKIVCVYSSMMRPASSVIRNSVRCT
jgi:hypothetical protein